MTSFDIDTVLLLNEEPSAQFIRGLFEHCFANGVSTQQSGSTASGLYFGASNNLDFEMVPTMKAIDEMATHRWGTVKIWYAGIALLFGIPRRDNDEYISGVPHLWLSADGAYFRTDGDDNASADVQANVDSYIELVRLLADYASPFYGCGFRTRLEDDRFPLTASPADLTEGKIDEWFWLNILHPEAIENIGRERVFTAPAWRRDELSDGSVMIIASANPRDLDATERGKEAIREHFGFGR